MNQFTPPVKFYCCEAHEWLDMFEPGEFNYAKDGTDVYYRWALNKGWIIMTELEKLKFKADLEITAYEEIKTNSKKYQ